jgi:hypothetical protein
VPGLTLQHQQQPGNTAGTDSCINTSSHCDTTPGSTFPLTGVATGDMDVTCQMDAVTGQRSLAELGAQGGAATTARERRGTASLEQQPVQELVSNLQWMDSFSHAGV